MISPDKTTVFGNPEDFAIEAGIEPDLIPPSPPWGHMCVWCHGIQLGDIQDRHCGLECGNFVWMAKNLDQLWFPNLDGLDDLGVWNFLDGMLYGYHGETKLVDERTLAQVRADSVRYGGVDFLTNWGESFDHHKAFLLCPPGRHLRVLCREFPPGVGLGVDISRVGFVTAVTQFASWYEEQTRRLHG